MKSIFLISLLLIAAAPLTAQEEANGRAFVAVALAAVEHDAPEPGPEPDVPACKCSGSGRSGDGLGPCVCGPECKCASSSRPEEPEGVDDLAQETTDEDVTPEEAEAPKPRVSLLWWTATWCGPCLVAERTVVPELRKKGFTVGTQRSDDVHQIDVDKFPQGVKDWKITAVPCLIFLVDDQPVYRHEGALSADEIERRFRKYRKAN